VGRTGLSLFHRGQNFIERHSGERGGLVGSPVGNNQLPAVQQTAAGVNDVGDVAFTFIIVRSYPTTYKGQT
jgi:hypothetical protein